MCNLAGKVFIYAQKGKGSNNVELKITKGQNHGEPCIRLSISADGMKKLGVGVERIVLAVHPDFRNRLYIYDARSTDCEGFKLSKNGSRYSFPVSVKKCNFDLLKITGEYSFERDKYNDIYIALNTTI